MDKAQQILAGIAKSHAPAHAALKIAGRAAHVKGDHALILVPDVHHAVKLFGSGGNPKAGKEPFPVFPQRLQRGVKSTGGIVAGHHCLGRSAVDAAGRRPFFSGGQFQVTQTEEQGGAFTGSEIKIELLRGDRLPAMGNTAGASLAEDGGRMRRTSVNTEKCLARGVKPVCRTVGPENGVMVASLTVFRFMINRIRCDLNFTDGIVALEVGTIVIGVPEAELQIGEYLQLPRLRAVVAQRQADEQAVVAARDQHLLPDSDAVLFRFNDGIPKTLTAAVAVRFGLNRLPAGVPDRVSVTKIDAETLGIQRAVVVAVASQPPQPGITVKTVTAGGVADQREKVLAAEIVDPGQGGAGSGDHIFAKGVVKIAVFHVSASF